MSDKADEAKLTGAEAALAQQSEWLVCVAHEFIKNFKSGETLTGEDIRLRVRDTCGEPRSANAWGAAILSISKNGLILDTGKMTKPKSLASHSRSIKIWEVA